MKYGVGGGEDLGKDRIKIYCMKKNLFSLECTKAKGLMHFFILTPVTTDLNSFYVFQVTMPEFSCLKTKKGKPQATVRI